MGNSAWGAAFRSNHQKEDTTNPANPLDAHATSQTRSTPRAAGPPFLQKTRNEASLRSFEALFKDF